VSAGEDIMNTVQRAARTRRTALIKPVAAAVALAFCAAAGLPARASTIDWIDWYARTPTGVLGTLRLGDEMVQVTFTGPYNSAFTDALPEPYWGPASTYTNSQISNAPPRSDMIFIGGGPEMLSLSFSQSVPNPIFAVASLGLIAGGGATSMTSSMEFDRSFEVLSNGRNFYGQGMFTRFVQNGNTLSGVESSGTLRMLGNLNTVQWRSPLREESNGVLVGTYGFTIGNNCQNYRVGTSPLTVAGAVARGCTAFNDIAMVQLADFELRGRLINRAGGRWVQNAAMGIAESGGLTNDGIFVIDRGLTLASRGQINIGVEGAAMDVHGTLIVNAGRLDNFGLITLLGDEPLGTGGRIEIASPGLFMSAGTVTLEPTSRLVVGGTLENNGPLTADAARAVVEVRAVGTLTTSKLMTVGAGGLDNRGLVRVAAGGELRLTESTHAAPNVLNRGTLEVQTFGLLRLAGPANPNAPVGVSGSFRNANNGTVNVDGRVELAGTFDNGGLVQVDTAGDITTTGPFGSFSQGGTGQLLSRGRIELANNGRMVLDGSGAVAGLLQVNAGSLLTVAAGGTLTMQPQGAVNTSQLFNQGSVQNLGKLLLLGTAGSFSEHLNFGSINNSGLLRIGADSVLTNAATLHNSGRFLVDAQGLLYATSDGSSITQSDSGVFVNNGTVSSPESFIFFGGRVTGNGTYATNVTFDDLSLEPGEDEGNLEGPLNATFRVDATASASTFQTGTMHFAGNVVLGAGTTLRLKFSENNGNDKLILGGSLVRAGGRIELVFPVNSAPGLDQVFSFHESPTGWDGGFSLTAPADYELTELNLTPGADGLQRRAAVFTPRGAAEFTAVGLAVGIDVGQQRYIQTPIEGAGIDFWNAGVLGIRNLPDSSLRVRSFINDPRASLLNSAFFTVNERFTNQGVVKNRAGAEFINLGRLENQAGATLDNRGLLVNGAAGRIINRGQLVLHGELRDESLLGAAGQQTVLNDGGRVDIQASGRLVGSGRFEQSGAGASTRVDGLLQAASIFISEGSLGGSGRIQGALSLGQDAQLAPGNSPGTLTVEGSLTAYGGEFIIELAGAQSFDRLVVDGDVLLSSTVRFRLVDGYTPLAGDSWTWLAVSGEVFYLDLYWGLEVPDGTGWALLADANGTYDTQGLLPERALFSFDGYTLSLSQAPVPEPGTWALWLAGLAAVTRIARKRGVPQPSRAD